MCPSEKKLKQIGRLEQRLQSLKISLSIFVLMVVFAATGGLELVFSEIEKEEKSEVMKNGIVETEMKNDVRGGIHLPSGLIAQGDFRLVIQHCTSCHSAKLITQNRMTAKNWRKTIKWMQETQNLWELGVSESKIVNYLGKWYAPKKMGRRKPLHVEHWYEIE